MNQTDARPAASSRRLGKPATWGLFLLGFIVLIGWVYSPVLTSNYGWMDDYQLLTRVAGRTYDLRNNEYVQGGRPLLGWATAKLFLVPHSIDTLNRARFISAAGIVVFALCAFLIFQWNEFDVPWSLTAAALMCLTPGFAVYAAWLTDGLNSYAAAAALLAGCLISVAVERQRFQRVCFLLGGAILLLAAYATHQSVAAFAAVALLIRAFRHFNLDWPRALSVAIGLGWIMAVTAFYFVAYKICCVAFHLTGQSQRSAFTKDFFDNLRFVLTDLLWSGLTGWSQFHSRWLQIVTACIFTLALLYACVAAPQKTISARFLALACVSATLLVSVLPLLLLSEHFFTFRTQTVLHATIAFVFLLGFEKWIRQTFAIFGARWFRRAGFGALVLAAAWVTRFHVDRDFVAPNVREVAALAAGLDQLKSFPDKMVFIVPAQWREFAPNRGEFQARSSPFSWVTAPLLELLLIQKFENGLSLHQALRKHSGFEVQYGPSTNSALPLLDGFTLLDGNSARVHDPYWGSLQTNQNGWCVSDWLGVFANRRFPLICHSQLGWLTCSGSGTDDFWFHSDQFGDFWTSPKSYPFLYFKKNDTWFYLSPVITWPTCSFLNVKTKEWTFSP